MKPSILYAAGTDNPAGPLVDHRFAVDLNLDQIFAAVNAGREGLDLASIFYAPVSQLENVTYRHEVLADLERPDVRAEVRAFGRGMRQCREILGPGAVSAQPLAAAAPLCRRGFCLLRRSYLAGKRPVKPPTRFTGDARLYGVPLRLPLFAGISRRWSTKPARWCPNSAPSGTR